MQSGQTNLCKAVTPLQYEAKKNRFWLLYQHCYSANEIVLLQKIRQAHVKIGTGEKTDFYFGFTKENIWYGLWGECNQPSHPLVKFDIPLSIFTLQNIEPKDSHHYPLAAFAEKMAKQISNWQAERVRAQTNPILANDPMMLVFEELKDWLLNDIYAKPCQKDESNNLIKREFYIEQLLDIIPPYGPDLLHLHQLKQQLEAARKLVDVCIANKALPTLLSDLIVSEKNLEKLSHTYLHFLLINEKVSDNYDDLLENCNESPICRIQKASMPNDRAITPLHSSIAITNKFYTVKVIQANSVAELELKKEAVHSIHFANFVTEKEKLMYLEIIAMIDSLQEIRSIFENLNHLLPKVGTYFFAFQYLENFNLLAKNYLQLLSKLKFKITDVIKIADNGINIVLSNPHTDTQNSHFKQNYHRLKTRFVGESTLLTTLENNVNALLKKLQLVQNEMQLLVDDVKSGKAEKDLKIVSRELLQQMAQLNNFLPFLLESNKLELSRLTFHKPLIAPVEKTELPTWENEVCLQTSSATRLQPFLSTCMQWLRSFTYFDTTMFTRLIAAPKKTEQLAPHFNKTTLKHLAYGLPLLVYLFKKSNFYRWMYQKKFFLQSGEQHQILLVKEKLHHLRNCISPIDAISAQYPDVFFLSNKLKHAIKKLVSRCEKILDSKQLGRFELRDLQFSAERIEAIFLQYNKEYSAAKKHTLRGKYNFFTPKFLVGETEVEFKPQIEFVP